MKDAPASPYTARDGSRWNVEPVFPPVPTTAYDWCASHVEYDGAPDAHDRRSVYAATREDVCAKVEEFIAEQIAEGVWP
jgi:hypothetical protein